LTLDENFRYSRLLFRARRVYVRAAEKLAQAQTTTGGELPPAARAEAQQSYRAVLEKYGDRLNDEQKKDIARLLEQQQRSIESVRAFMLDNDDAPASALRLHGPEDTNAAR
jgi:hypothetical protein